MAVNTITLAIALLATPLSCPPEGSQVRWEGVQIRINGLRVQTTVWDRNRDGRPSSGDLLRVEEARKGRTALNLDETWALMRGRLAKRVRRAVKSRRTRAACDPLFFIEDVPKASSDRALARLIRANSASMAPTRRQRARSEMSQWAARLCKSKRSISKDQLTQRLEKRALRRHRSLGRGTVHALAEEVAHENAVSCANLRVAKGLVF